MGIDTIHFPPELIAKIVRCVEDSVGDDIHTDILQNDLRTTNSVPFRIWDFLNSNLIKSLEMEDCTVAETSRGPWQMVIVFERTTQYIFTFMREKRFSELRRTQHRRKRMHYLDALTRQFNPDLVADQQQLSFLPHTFSDENMLPELVQTLLCDLGSDISIVRNHVLILFETAEYQLTHIRAVMVTPNLDIVQNIAQDWSPYISANVSSVVDKVSHPEAPENQPNRNLKLKAKAITRKKDKSQQHRSKEDKILS